MTIEALAETGVEAPQARAADSVKAAELIARIESVPFSRWHVRPRVIMGSATFFDAFSALSLASATPVLVRLWHLTPAQVGYLLAASYIGQFAGALIFGWLGERIGRVMSATYATLIMAVVSLACALTGNFWQMFICRLVQGIGVGGEMPVAATYVNELSRARGRGRFFMLYELIFPIGFLAAAVLGAQLVPVYGWNVLFIIGTIPGNHHHVVGVAIARIAAMADPAGQICGSRSHHPRAGEKHDSAQSGRAATDRRDGTGAEKPLERVVFACVPASHTDCMDHLVNRLWRDQRPE